MFGGNAKATHPLAKSNWQSPVLNKNNVQLLSEGFAFLIDSKNTLEGPETQSETGNKG